jgi:protein-L-isoaspartate(D-aspartate) O-methyltransferase
MVIPVGERYQQTLYLMRKTGGQLEREALRPTLFVPMTGTAEDRRKVHADPGNPRLVNGDFEEPPPENGYMPGWYYQRELTWESSGESPSGQHHIQFRVSSAGRPANLLQGLALDGRVVKRVRLSGYIKLTSVRPGLARDELPAITIRFFDEDRSLLATNVVGGPFRGTRKWKRESRIFRVPSDAREAIVSVGLFGATGIAAFDDIQLVAVGR